MTASALSDKSTKEEGGPPVAFFCTLCLRRAQAHAHEVDYGRIGVDATRLGVSSKFERPALDNVAKLPLHQALVKDRIRSVFTVSQVIVGQFL